MDPERKRQRRKAGGMTAARRRHDRAEDRASGLEEILADTVATQSRRLVAGYRTQALATATPAVFAEGDDVPAPAAPWWPRLWDTPLWGTALEEAEEFVAGFVIEELDVDFGIQVVAEQPFVRGIAAQHVADIDNWSLYLKEQVGEIIERGHRDAMSIPQVTELIEDAGLRFGKQATTVARTEMVSASNAASHTGAAAFAEPGDTKRWMAARDSRTRDSHRKAHDQVVPFDQPFIVGGARLQHPGDRAGPPEEVINCRCTFVWQPADPTPTPEEATPEPETLDIALGPDVDYRDHVQPGRYVFFEEGPTDRSVTGRAQDGLAFVEDDGTMYYATRPLRGTTAERAAKAREKIELMRRANQASLPPGFPGAKAHMAVKGRSADDAYWSKRYGTDFRVAANASQHRVVHFASKVNEEVVWHENGHVVAIEMNNRLLRALPDPDPQTLFDEAFEELSRERNLPEPVDSFEWVSARAGTSDRSNPKWIEADEELQAMRQQLLEDTRALAEVRREEAQSGMRGIGTKPGPEWERAAERDAERLAQQKFRDFREDMERGDQHPVKVSGRGVGAGGDEAFGVTDYGASDLDEDWAESWRLFVRSQTDGSVGSHIDEDGNRVPTRFEDLFPHRHRFIVDAFRAIGEPLPAG